MKKKDILNLILGSLFIIPAIILTLGESKTIITNVIGIIWFVFLYKYSFSKIGKDICKSFIRLNFYYKSLLIK